MLDYEKMGYRKDFDPNNKVVKQEHIDFQGKTFYVSTVDSGRNHNFNGGPPLYYETMIFPEGAYSEMYCDRYTDRETALKAHEQLIRDIKDGKYTIEDEWFVLKEAESNET